VTDNPTKRRGALLPLEPSEEEGLAALLRKAQRKAYTLAHSHILVDIPIVPRGCQPSARA
jgi:hypothetical protein